MVDGGGTFWRSRVGRHLLVPLLFFSSVVVIGLSAVELFWEYRSGLRALEHRLDDIERGYATLVADGIWAMDRWGVELLARGIAGLPGICHVEVWDSDIPNPNTLEIHSGGAHEIDALVRDVPLVHSDKEKTYSVGRMTVWATRRDIYKALWSRGWIIVGEQILKTVLVVTFFLFVFHRKVTRRIVGLSERVAAFGEVPADLPLRGKSDEVDRLDATFAIMRESIAAKGTDLRQALEFSQGILKALPDPLFELDRHGTYLNVWAPRFEMLAAPPQLLLGRNVADVLSEDAAGTVMACLAEAAEIGLSFGKVIQIDLPHGPGWFELSCTRVRQNSREGDDHFLVVARDVTRRKRFEEELKARERQYRTLVEHSPDMIARYDRDCRRVYVSVNLAHKLGMAPDSLVGRRPSEQFAITASTQLEERLKEVLATGRPLMFAMEWRGGVWLETRLIPELGKDGGVENVLAIYRDISDSKLVDSTLRFVADPAGMGHDGDFLSALARHLSDVLGVAYVIIDRLDEEPGFAETVALCAQGEIQPNMRYALAGTPCADVANSRFCSYARDVQALFPDDLLLVDMGVHSYAGVPLLDTTGKAIGLIAVLDTAPFDNEALVGHVLHIITPRAAAELERAESDRKLAQREQQYRSLAESAPDHIIRYDRDQRIRYLNSRLAETLELPSPEAVIGKHPAEIWPDGRFNAIVQAAVQAMEGGETVSVEMKAGGRLHHVLVVPDRDSAGNVIGTIAFGRDVGELVRIDRERQRLQHAVNQSIDTFFVVMADGRIAVVNDTACRSLGYSRDEFRDMTVADIDPDYSLAEVKQLILSLERDKPLLIESRHCAKDGRIFPVEITVSLFEEDDRSCIAIARDISDRKAHEVHQTHLNQVLLGIWKAGRHLDGDLDEQELFPQVCAAFVAQGGYRSAWISLVGQDDKAFAQAAPAEDTDGEDHSCIGFGLRNAESEVFGCLAIACRDPRGFDLDEVALLAEFAGNLASSVLVRRERMRRKGIERQLAQAQKFEALGQLAGNVAHDFNNLLGAILGFADLIVADAPADHSSHRLASRIVAAGEHGRELVSRILTFARRAELRFGHVPLATVLAETEMLLTGSIPATTRLSVVAEENAGTVVGDRSQIVHLLSNLCINAHHALDGGHGEISVVASRTPREGETFRRLCRRAGETASDAIETWCDPHGAAYAVFGCLAPDRRYRVLTVSDTGCGMGEALLAQAFTPFFTTKGPGRGTGMGLAAVHGTVLAHGGALAVESRPGAGTTFVVFLPAADDDDCPPPATGDESAKAVSALPTVTGGRVLLVDDDPHFCDMLFAVLEQRGFEVAPCSDPREALEAIHEFGCSWDVLVTDQTMPHLTGIELIRAVRERCPSMPCILCTGFSEESLDAEVLREAGVYSLMHKPLDLETLVGAVAQAVAERRNSSIG